MSSVGMEVFDQAVQTAGVWLEDVMAAAEVDRKTAWRLTGVVLRELRDRLTPAGVGCLGGALPLIVRGAYYDGYRPDQSPTRHDLEAFAVEVRRKLADVRRVDPRAAMEAVFVTVWRHVPESEFYEVLDSLPQAYGDYWFEAIARETGLDQYRPEDEERRLDGII